MIATAEESALVALRAACGRVGLDAENAERIRIGENAIYRLTAGLVARVARAGQLDAAAKEVNVARWLERSGLVAVRAVPNIEQPVNVNGRAVTFWHALPPHENGSPAQMALALRRLHSLTPPTDFALAPIEPFVRLAARIDAAGTLADDDRAWMRERLAELHYRWGIRPAGLPDCVVHGDAWAGNVVSAAHGVVMFLDLERVAVGPPEWDLVHTAIKHTSFGWLSAEDYAAFRDAYGHDVTDWTGFALFRDVREFRMTCMAAQVAAENPNGHSQAIHRLRCIQGDHGLRPWSGWHALP